MANELKHSSVGTELTQAEWEAVDGHVVNSQAVGDLIYAETTSSLQRLAIGSTNDVLRVTGGKPDWQATSFITSLGTIATGVWQGTDVGVAYGGTGVSTLTDGGVLLGSGASAITAMAVLSDGQMIVGNGSTDPVAESGATLRSSIGVGTGDSPSLTGLTLSGVLSVDDATESTSATTGSIHTDGGLGVAKKLFLNGNLDFSGGTGTIEKVAGENTLYWRKTALVHSAANAGSSQALIVENQSSTAHSHGKLQMQALNGDAFVYYVTTTGATVEWAAGLDHTDAQSFVVSNSSGLGSSNVLKIPNSSGHIVASRGISVDDTTESTSTTTGSIHTDGGLGVVKNAFFGGTILAVNGGSNTTTVIGETTGSSDAITFSARVPASSTGNAGFEFKQGDGSGSANNMSYLMDYNANAGYLRLRSRDIDGSSTDNDNWRVYDGNADIRAKDDWVDDYFDYICDGCNKHSGELFACCGAVKWHDDVLALREMGKDEKIMQRMVDLGVMHRDDRDGWVGISLQAAQHFTWSGIYQNRTRMDAQYETLNDRMELLERKLEAV